MADTCSVTPQIDALKKELTTLAEARDKAKETVQAETDRATALVAELETVKGERHSMWQARNKAQDALAEAETAAKAEIETLQCQVRDLQQRLPLAREKLRRTEGQVELIKDLLLREAGL